jgi:hypothetical protein
MSVIATDDFGPWLIMNTETGAYRLERFETEAAANWRAVRLNQAGYCNKTVPVALYVVLKADEQ